MRKYIVQLLVLCTLLGTASQANEDTSEIISGLLNFGAKAIQAKQQRQTLTENNTETSQSQHTPAAPPNEVEEATAALNCTPNSKRGWEERGKDMLETFFNTTGSDISMSSTGKLLGQGIKEAMDVVANEYKEQYKEEGRRYARELGDKIVERVQEDPNIKSSLLSVKTLCWSVIAYLTVVTLVMIFSLLHIKRLNTQLLQKLEEFAAKK